MVELHVKNPHSERFNIATIQMEVTCDVKYKATEDFKLAATVSNVKTHVTKFIPYFYTRTSLKDLQ